MAMTNPESEPERESVRVLRPRRAVPTDVVRPTRAEVSLPALRHNLRAVRRHAGAAAVYPVLKADGYGHGAPAVARTLERAGADGFCVALLEEAVELRDAGIRAPLLVLGGRFAGAHDALVEHDVRPVLHDVGEIDALARSVRARGLARRFPVHVKVDTGMARLGASLGDLPALVAALGRAPELELEGLMTHFACADEAGDAATEAQLARFAEAEALLVREGHRPRVRHAANSAAILRGRGLFELVRPGLAIFGLGPRTEDGVALGAGELRPVMRVRTQVVALHELPAGSPVGYGATFRTTRPSRVATVPMGYADGLSRALGGAGGRGQLVVRGRAVPIVGAVSMDLTTVDVTDVPGVALGDEVVVLGSQASPGGGEAVQTAEDVARAAGTIAWEVLTSLSRRVPRFYREP